MKQPINGTFELTSNCNFNCKMCYVHSCKAVSPCIPAEHWLGVIAEARKCGLLYVLVTGGEPLLHPQFREIFSYLTKFGMLTVLNTNGYLIDSSYVQFLKKHRPVRMNITLYGTSNEVYGNLCGVRDGFSVVDRNIRTLKENGFNVNLNMTFVRDNIGQMQDMIAYAKDLQLELRPTTYVFPSAGGDLSARLPAEDAARAAVKMYGLIYPPEKVKMRLESIRKSLYLADNSPVAPECSGTWCRAGKASYWIHADGKMAFCGMTDAGDMPDVFSVGFQKAWHEVCEKASRVNRPRMCTTCRYRFTCHVCHAMMQTEEICEDSVESSYPCIYYKTYADAFLKEYETML